MAAIWKGWRGARERRREPRRISLGLAVDSPAMAVELVDASGSGLGVEAERPLRIGVIYPFRVCRDEQVSEIYGLVRWCEVAARDRFRAGISVGKTIGTPLSRLAP